MKSIKKKALQLLTSLGFKIKGYYPYDSVIDVVGYFEPIKPFQYSTKTLVEIRQDEPTVDSIESFFKLGKNTLAEKMILFAKTNLEHLQPEIRTLLAKLSIEYFDADRLSQSLKETTKPVDTSTMKNAFDLLSAKKLAEVIPDLAEQVIPVDIQKIIPDREAWEVFEDAIFAVFNFCFGYETKQLGKETLFQNEPEGMVICPNKNGSYFGLIYDCKTATKSYKMTKEDELIYIDYIKKKKREFEYLHNCDLQYFLIISPKFSGNLALRKNAVHQATGVLLCFISAASLSRIALWAYNLPNNLKRLTDISDFLLPTEVVVSDKTVDDFIKKFDEKRKSRY